jgi:hypothetical protein
VDQRSKLTMSRIPWTKNLCGVMTLLVVFVAIVVVYSRPAHAVLTCGAQPEVAPADLAEQIKSDAKSKASLIIQAPPSVDLRKFVIGQRRDLRLTYAKADKLMMDHYLLWATCQTISNDRTIAGSEQFEEYSRLYRLLSEPMDKVTAPAE